uniref:alpha-N-acetylgalactosaminide alpha-2,6-sialyltransferase n=1 Tax=Neolamprologus brichardi TaxID=32507 RepID=A0A3Q4H1H6_NEOBR
GRWQDAPTHGQIHKTNQPFCKPLLLPKPGGDGCVHCAVVGTAGILNGSKVGAEIDAHDYIFRMNGAITKGFEEDVGNRTSVYVHTAYSITASPSVFGTYGYKSAPHDEVLKMQCFLTCQYFFSSSFYMFGLFSVHFPLKLFFIHRFLKSPNLNETFWPIVRPTNGAFTLFLALHTCDTVDAYGFMTDEYMKYSNYYFEKYIKSNVIFYANHDYILEKNTWKNFHKRKIIKLYQRTEPETKTETPKQH